MEKIDKKFPITYRRARVEDSDRIREYCEKSGVNFRPDAVAIFVALEGEVVIGVSFVLRVTHIEPLVADSIFVSKTLFEKSTAFASTLGNRVFMTVRECNDDVKKTLERYGAVTIDSHVHILEKEI